MSSFTEQAIWTWCRVCNELDARIYETHGRVCGRVTLKRDDRVTCQELVFEFENQDAMRAAYKIGGLHALIEVAESELLPKMGGR